MTPVLDNLPVLVLSPHGRCNCRCVMCDIWKDASAPRMEVAELARHLDDIRALRVRQVVLTGGEPLMHPDLFLLCGMLRPLGIRLTLLSTGLLLGRHACDVVESVDEVIVSLDGPPAIHDRIRRVAGAFDAMAAGVRALRVLDPRFPVSARCTVQKENHTHLVETVEAARTAGLDSLSFLAADLVSTAFNRPDPWPDQRRWEVALTEAETLRLATEVERLIVARYGCFVRESAGKLRRIVQHFRAHLGLEPPQSPRCNAPWVSAVVETGGAVRPCFFHPPIGSLERQSLREAVNSAEAVRFRRELDIAADPVCRRCVCALYREADAVG